MLINQLESISDSHDQQRNLPSLHSKVWNNIHAHLNNKNSSILPKWGNTEIVYVEGHPIYIELAWEITLVLMSVKDFKKEYKIDMSPLEFILVNKKLLKSSLYEKWYKWVRKFEPILLWREVVWSTTNIASRLGIDTTTYVSKVHALLELKDDSRVIISDLWSANGTTVQTASYINLDISHSINGITNLVKNQLLIDADPFLKTLWPNIQFWMSQWKVWNCYFIASLNAIKENPNGYHLLKKLISQDPSWKWKVTFGKWFYTMIWNEDLEEVENKSLKKWSLGDRILERAYWRIRFNEYTHSENNINFLIWLQLHKSTETALEKTKTGQYTHEWWDMSELVETFFSNQVDTYNFNPIHSNRPNDEQIEKFIFLYNTVILNTKWAHIITAATTDLKYLVNIKGKDILRIYFPKTSEAYMRTSNKIQSTNADDIYENLYQQILSWEYSNDEKYFELADIFGNLCKFPFIHWYSVGEVNLSKGYIEIVNPHDTLNMRYKISIKNFIKYGFKLNVNSISIVQ